MRVRMTLVACALVTCAVSAQGPNARQEIEAANKAWFDAFVRGDVNAMDQMETDDFVFIQDGRLVDKADQIGRLRRERSGKRLPQAHIVEFHSVTVKGRVAVATGFNTIRGAKGSAKAAFSEVWVRDANRWRIQMGHYSADKGVKPRLVRRFDFLPGVWTLSRDSAGYERARNEGHPDSHEHLLTNADNVT